MPLIIVESPTKARTFNRILKQDKGNYFVYATMGHIRDLPSNTIAINYENNFEDQLKKLSTEHDEIILATDLDREGESISYHVAYLLGKIDEKWPEINIKDKKLKRIVFHEITKEALEEALKETRTLNEELFNAQQARRILDRIVGYKLSPLLWKKVKNF